jgi:serine/threonine-protein kinase
MSEDNRRAPGSGTDPTLTPSQLAGYAPTSADTDGPPAPARAASGSLPDRYTLGAQLGAGGMGEVLLATDRQIDREVAIKRMRIVPTPDAVARFEREAKIQGRLEHPAIVPVHELAFDAEGRPFFVMKRLTGTTLAELLERGGHVTRQKLLRAFADVCLAMEFAHQRGVVHRDLKPANIMLGDFGEVYVLDWGVARRLDDEQPEASGDTLADQLPGSTAAGVILGTPGYIAPELLRGERVDTRADVYALGCILFEILAGEALLPRGRAALEAALGRVDARPSVRTSAVDVPPELDELCVEATTSDRAGRPSARELATRIEKYLDGDRDLSLRKQVAASHASAARDALGAGDGAAERAIAMREAGRAIAIDPANRDAAELVAQLMLEPPREVPPEVDARVTDAEDVMVRDKIRMILGVEISFLLVVPIVFMLGLRSTSALVLLLVAIAVNILVTGIGVRRTRPPTSGEVYVAAIIFAGLVGVCGWLFSPFLIAPAMGAVTVMMFTVDARMRWMAIVLMYSAAVGVPWALEASGVVSPTMYSVGGDLVIHSPLVRQDMPIAAVGLAVFTGGLLVIAGFLASRLAQSHRRAVRSVELQAWHLRQLVS